MSSHETLFEIGGDPNEPKTPSTLLLQVDNGKKFGVLTFSFNENNRITGLNAQVYLTPVPDLTIYWIFTLLMVCVFAFNIYAIIRIIKSRLKWKFAFCALVVLLNITTIEYHAIAGFIFQPFSAELLNGIGFAHMGYINTYSGFGLPLGALFSLWMVRRKSKEPLESLDGSIEDESISDSETTETLSNE